VRRRQMLVESGEINKTGYVQIAVETSKEHVKVFTIFSLPLCVLGKSIMKSYRRKKAM
jgi:hypothetical protein